MIRLEKMYHIADNDDYELYDVIDISNSSLFYACKELVSIMLLPYREEIDVKIVQLFSDNDAIVTLSEWGEYKEGTMRNRGLIKLYDKDYEIALLNNSTTQRKGLGVYNILVELEKLGIVAQELDILIKDGEIETIRVISDSRQISL